MAPIIEQELETWLSPVLITIWYGANDAALSDGHNWVQHVPLDEYRANLHALVRRMRSKAPHAEILLVTPPTVDDAKRQAKLKHGNRLDRSNNATSQYAEACRQVAAEAGVPVLDAFAHFDAMATWRRRSYFVDGLHFNSRGNKEFDTILREKIEETFPKLETRLERWQLPDWESFID